MIRNLTSEQVAAVVATGNVLLGAGAGTGKTATLVERVLYRVGKGMPIDRVLMVTFTEAAAAEMKERLRVEVERRAHSESGGPPWMEELARLPQARIGTLHGFCLRLVKGHAFALGLDPGLTVLDDAHRMELVDKAWDVALWPRLDPQSPSHDESLGKAVDLWFRGESGILKDWVVGWSHHAWAQPDAWAWIEGQKTKWSREDPPDESAIWTDEVRLWAAESTIRAQYVNPANAKIDALRHLLKAIGENPAQAAELLKSIVSLNDEWPSKTKTRDLPELKRFFEGAAFLASVAESSAREEDWRRCRNMMRPLIHLMEGYCLALAELKVREAVLDFSDLEQYANRLLSTPGWGVQASCREQFDEVLVDECQDLNAAQDAILRSVCREGSDANRFMVGDLQQSIYRFRQADPRIFATYSRDWSGESATGRCLALRENFRSAEGILKFVDAVFHRLLGASGTAYAPLQFGDPQGRSSLGITGDGVPRIEVVWHRTGAQEDSGDGEDEPATESAEVDSPGIQPAIWGEADEVARRIGELHAMATAVWDRRNRGMRPMKWSDVAVLMRAPTGRAATYAAAMAARSIPVSLPAGWMKDQPEVRDIEALLQVLDNPLQDLPMLALLRSPFGNVLSPDELLVIRMADAKGSIWEACRKFSNVNGQETSQGSGSVGRAASPGASEADAEIQRVADRCRPRVEALVSGLIRWRELGRTGGMARLLEVCLDESGYEAGLGRDERGRQGRANLLWCLEFARNFDRKRPAGVHDFVRYFRRTLESGVEAPEVGGGDAVRILSIHRSKGLEFPIVFVAGLGGQFNRRDLSGDVGFDEAGDLCPLVVAEDGARYPSLGWHRAARENQRAMMAEEARLLYVAFTRAADRLILSGKVPARRMESWARESHPGDAKSPADWIGPILGTILGKTDWCLTPAGSGELFSWRIVDDKAATPARVHEPDGQRMLAFDPVYVVEPGKVHYAYDSATREPAKQSVSALRRAAVGLDDTESASAWGPRMPVVKELSGNRERNGLSATELGEATHAYLEWLDLGKTESMGELEEERRRLVRENRLEARLAEGVDLRRIHEFWSGGIGREILRHRERLRREFPFTARLEAAALHRLGLPTTLDSRDSEFIVVQGIVDLAVIHDAEIWILDFKTDEISGDAVWKKAGEYRTQLEIYAHAMEGMFARPVTKKWLCFLRTGGCVELSAIP